MTKLPNRDQRVVRALGVVLVLNWAVALGKLVLGVATGRVTIVADGLHSVLDGANNVLGIATIRIAAQPPDDDHPYGHRKFESLAALLIGGLIALVAWEVLDNVARTIWRRSTASAADLASTPSRSAENDLLFAGILLVSIAANWLVARYELAKGRELESPLLAADAGHTRSDCAVTGLSVASLLLGHHGWWVDPLLALGVLLFLGRASWQIIADNLPALTDRAHLDPELVREVAERVDGVLGAHGIRSHGVASDIHLDLSLRIDGDVTALEAEAIEKRARAALREAFPGLTLIGIHHCVSPDDEEE